MDSIKHFFRDLGVAVVSGWRRWRDIRTTRWILAIAEESFPGAEVSVRQLATGGWRIDVWVGSFPYPANAAQCFYTQLFHNLDRKWCKVKLHRSRNSFWVQP